MEKNQSDFDNIFYAWRRLNFQKPDFPYADKLISNATNYNLDDSHIYEIETKLESSKLDINKGIYILYQEKHMKIKIIMMLQ